EGALQRMEIVRRAEPLDGPDLASLRLHRKHQARAYRLVVKNDRAGTTDSVLAADVGAGLTAIVADGVDQRLARLDPDRVVTTIDVEDDVDFFVHAVSGRAAGRP